MTHIKICGITNLADARFAAGAGADFLGFIQHAESPRYVDPKQAKEIIEWVYGARPVGVFVNAEPELINDTASFTGFDFVQMHGDESPDTCSRIDRPVIKAIRVQPGWSRSDVELAVAAYAEVADYILFDTWNQALFGGTGHAFDWSILSSADLPLPYFLAGGLRPDTVAAAIAMCQPFGVDVSSGVEEAPGQKDFTAITAFVDAIRP